MNDLRAIDTCDNTSHEKEIIDPFAYLSFDIEDSVETFLEDLFDFSVDIYKCEFETGEEIEFFFDKVVDMLKYMRTNRVKLLFLDTYKQGHLNKNFVVIQEFTKELINDKDFIDTMLKRNEALDLESSKQWIEKFLIELKNVYYLVISNDNKTIPEVLKIDSLIDLVKPNASGSIPAENLFGFIAGVDEMCKYFLGDKLIDLNLEQLEEITDNFDTIFLCIEDLLCNDKIPRTITLENFVDLDIGFKVKVEKRLEELRWREEKVAKIEDLSNVDVSLFLEDSKKFIVFKNSFILVSNEFDTDSEIVNKMNDTDKNRIRLVLLVLYKKLKDAQVKAGIMLMQIKEGKINTDAAKDRYLGIMTSTIDNMFKSPLARDFDITYDSTTIH